MHALLFGLLGLLCLGCRLTDDLSQVPDQQGGFIELTVDGKTIDDPQSPLCPTRTNSIKLSCFARQQVDTAGWFGSTRSLWIDFFSGGINDIGQLGFYFVDFQPGAKPIQANRPRTWQNTFSFIGYWGGDLPEGRYDFDETQPYSFIINKYDTANRFIEGSFDVPYVRGEFKIPMRATTRQIRVQGRFKAKVRRMKEGIFID